MSYCLNCEKRIDLSQKYCAGCGQKTKVSTLSIGSIVKDFLSNLFNIENKIWRTLRDIWIPGKLSLAYIQGKRVQYYNPIRIFLIVLFTYFTVALLQINEQIQTLNEFSTEQQENVWADLLMTRYDSLVACQFILPDSLELKKALFIKEYRTDSLDVSELTNESITELYQIIDERTLVDKDSIYIIRDSLKEDQHSFLNLKDENKEGKKVTRPLQINRKEEATLLIDIPTSDLYRLNPTELKAKHGDGNKYYELGLEQLQKTAKDFSGSVQFLISNGTWAIIATILLMSLIFKLMYIRHNYLYAEHFIFHLYGHTRMLLLMLLITLISNTVGNETITSVLWWGWFISAAVYLYLGMKIFYGQARSKMKRKFLFSVLIAYPFIVFICMILIVLLSFLFI